MATPALAEFGSDSLRAEFLAPSIAGDLVSCIAVSEPEAGSDVAAIRTRAVRSGSDLIITGHKMWITSGEQTCVANVCFRREVPARCIIGEEGRGFFYQMLQFQDERLVAAAVLLEPLQRCIALTAKYASERKLFGSTVLDQQTVHFTLAELQSEVEAVRALLYRAVLSRLNGDDVTLLASMTKLKAGRLARVVTDSCLQFWGGNGFTWDNPVCRMHRDLRLHSVGAGADEVMLSIICKHMGIAPQKPRF
ncbi:acyl-CoA dehydrogenase protein [Teladorsagia circumcincta]|uniref:Acyl-CoA dehydrogenase protein n=1 Tax=Teladorsagia circumcincta TaxID=45464 RepID=A0A2G9V1K1_TELCI|nr:acyl-CoA dehydrogenase protein [Teladorsagia circumcincta]